MRKDISASQKQSEIWLCEIFVSFNRAFSSDIMLSSNMAVSIAMEINIMQASFYKILSMNLSIRGSSAWWLRACMVRVTALDIQVSLRNLMAILEDSMTSVKTLYSPWLCFSLSIWLIFLLCMYAIRYKHIRSMMQFWNWKRFLECNSLKQSEIRLLWWD